MSLEQPPEALASPDAPAQADAKRIMRRTAARQVPRELFGEQAPEPLQRPGWASSSPAQLRSWWPGQEPEPEPEPLMPSEPIHIDEVEVDEEQHDVLMGAAAHLEQVYDETFQEARDTGYKAGLEEGMREGRERAEEEAAEARDELATLVARIAQETSRLVQMRRKLLIEAESQGVELALAVGERLAERALLGDTHWVPALLREASETLTEGDRMICQLSPELARRLRQEGAMPELDGVFEISEDLGPLDLVVENHCGRVDAGFKERFRQLSRAIMTRVEEVRVEPAIEEGRFEVAENEPPTMPGDAS